MCILAVGVENKKGHLNIKLIDVLTFFIREYHGNIVIYLLQEGRWFGAGSKTVAYNTFTTF